MTWKQSIKLFVFLLILFGITAGIKAGEKKGENNLYEKWRNGPGNGPSFFPLAVWLQAPGNAPKYQQIGINLYVGLWKGPTAKQLAELKKHGMKVICSQNDYALKHLDDPTIVAWMHGDEPDNAQPLGKGKGYGPPILPKKIKADYLKIKSKDPSRPVILNIGQGVAWDRWYGRGVRTGHPEDYPLYIQGCDIVSFDIYPVVHSKPQVAGKLWYVPYGVKRLRKWAAGKKIVWNCIECTRISNQKIKPSPMQVKAEVWMSIIHGSQGIIYFCHQFKPRFIEAGLLADKEMAEAVGRINRQIQKLAPVINSRTLDNLATVKTIPTALSPGLKNKLGNEPVAIMVKRYKGALYLFTVRMEDSPCKAFFQVKGLPGINREVKVLGEGKTLKLAKEQFTDTFEPYEVHLYVIR